MSWQQQQPQQWWHWYQRQNSCCLHQNHKYIIATKFCMHWKAKVVNMPTLLTLVVAGTMGCHYDNLQYHQWWQSWHYDNSQCSMYGMAAMHTGIHKNINDINVINHEKVFTMITSLFNRGSSQYGIRTYNPYIIQVILCHGIGNSM